MRVFTVSTFIYAVLLLGLTACTNPNVQVDYFAKNILSSYDFEVKNSTNNVDIEPTLSNVLFDVECSKSVVAVEIQNPQTQNWSQVSDVDGAGKINCTADETAYFNVPVSFVSPTVNPISAGDQRYDVNVRLSVKNITGEITQYEKKYAALFKAPVVAANVTNINVASGISGGGTYTYTLSGSCSLPGASLDISAPFANADVSATCGTGNTFSANLSVNGSVTDGMSVVIVSSHAPTPYYALGQTTQNVIIDRVVPVVSLDVPANTTINNTVVTNSSFEIKGSCEAGLKVSFSVVGRGSAADVTCTNAGKFNGVLVFTGQGSLEIKALQTDVVGNPGSSSTLTLNVDTLAPLPFTISGVRSVSNADITVDDILGYSGAQVHFTASTGATGYEVYIRDPAVGATLGTTRCLKDDIVAGATSADLNACLTQALQGSKYQVYLYAFDAAGNKTQATGSPYEFTVQYPIPQITSVAVTPSGTYNSGAVGTKIYVDVTYDREVSVVSDGAAPTMPQLLLNSVSGGRAITYETISSDKVLRFAYTIGAGEYGWPLALNSSTMAEGLVRDLVHSKIEASRSLTSLAGTVNLDTVDPLGLSAVSAGIVPAYFDRTPAINFTLPADLNQPSLVVKATLKQGATVKAGPVTLSSGSFMSGLNLSIGTTYTVELYVEDSVQNIGPVASFDFDSFQCPDNFSYVYQSSVVATPFCVAATEAKEDGAGIAFDTSGLLKVNVTQSTAGALCAAHTPAGFPANKTALITNEEWNAVATQLASVASNWSSGTVGTGFIYNGNAASATLSHTYDSGNPCSPYALVNCTSSYPYRRYLTTTKGQKIYDFSGNAAEIIAGADTQLYNTLNSTIATLVTSPAKTKYGTALTCNNSSTNPYCGFGSIFTYCSEQASPYLGSCNGGAAGSVQLPIVLRGGSVSSGNTNDGLLDNAGIFAAFRTFAAADTGAYVGFRCVYHP